MMDINISKQNHLEIFIVPHVRFWWMDEKWHQHDIMVIIIGELHSNWKGVVEMSCTKMRLYIQWVPSPVAKHPFFQCLKHYPYYGFVIICCWFLKYAISSFQCCMITST